MKGYFIQSIQIGSIVKIFCFLTFFFFRKTWFSFSENVKQNICHDLTPNNINFGRGQTDNSSVQFSTPVELIIKDYSTIDWQPSFMGLMRPILLAIQFTSLCTCWTNLSVGTLVKLIGLLPNLDSLKVSHLLSQPPDSLSEEDTSTLRSVSISNKITKVWQLSDFESTRFLISLCRRVEHLEVKFIVYKELKRLIQFILIKTITHICYLRSICFRVYNANDQMIYDLQQLIDSEKLLVDYNITRKCNDIFLQWKLQ
jgi:hypothetical protein